MKNEIDKIQEKNLIGVRCSNLIFNNLNHNMCSATFDNPKILGRMVQKTQDERLKRQKVA